MGALAMAKPPSGLNPEVAEIVSAVVGSLGLEQAAIRLNYKVGKEGIRLLRMGKVGRESTVRDFAAGFADRICDLYGEEVRARFGEPSIEAASDWLAEKAGFGLRYHGKRELTYVPDEDNHTGSGLKGTERLSPRQLAILQAIIDEMGPDPDA